MGGHGRTTLLNPESCNTRVTIPAPPQPCLLMVLSQALELRPEQRAQKTEVARAQHTDALAERHRARWLASCSLPAGQWKALALTAFLGLEWDQRAAHWRLSSGPRVCLMYPEYSVHQVLHVYLVWIRNIQHLLSSFIPSYLCWHTGSLSSYLTSLSNICFYTSFDLSSLACFSYFVEQNQIFSNNPANAHDAWSVP